VIGVWQRRVGDEEDSPPEQRRGASRSRKPEPVAEPAAENSQEPDWWWQPLWTLTALAMFAGLLWSASESLWGWLDRPVTEVRVSGAVRHLDRVEVAQRVEPLLGSGLLSTDLASIQQEVTTQPWVRHAAVVRDWPQTLEVKVDEEVPVARWGEAGLLNHEGEIFWPELKQEYVALPRLSGPAKDTGTVMAQFHDLNPMFRRVGLKVVALDLEARGAWTLVLDNGIRVIVGRSAINERLERFLSLYTQVLAARSDEIDAVDIRYANGVSVKWKPLAKELDAG
jgi:cell division protein FtsQ